MDRERIAPDNALNRYKTLTKIFGKYTTLDWGGHRLHKPLGAAWKEARYSCCGTEIAISQDRLKRYLAVLIAARGDLVTPEQAGEAMENPTLTGSNGKNTTKLYVCYLRQCYAPYPAMQGKAFFEAGNPSHRLQQTGSLHQKPKGCYRLLSPY